MWLAEDNMECGSSGVSYHLFICLCLYSLFSGTLSHQPGPSTLTAQGAAPTYLPSTVIISEHHYHEQVVWF